MREYAQKQSDPSTIFKQLNQLFEENLIASLQIEGVSLARVEIKARAIDDIREILTSEQNLTTSQRAILPMFGELFADSICSIYFAACALDNPAYMLSRKILELGVATVYLWDLPHVFWAWKEHNQDLNFAEMLKHLDSPGYKTYVRSLNPNFTQPSVLDISLAKECYSELSDRIHGKMSTFESVLQNRYRHDANDWARQLLMLDAVEELLLQMWENRFVRVAHELRESMPQLSRVRYGEHQ